jgi:hypothetical protein
VTSREQQLEAALRALVEAVEGRKPLDPTSHNPRHWDAHYESLSRIRVAVSRAKELLK